MGAQDYHVSDTYNDSLDTLVLVTEMHRQAILQHSYNIWLIWTMQGSNIIKIMGYILECRIYFH